MIIKKDFNKGTRNMLGAYEDYENSSYNIRMVEVLIEFIRIGEIDTMNEKYQAEVRIEAKWKLNESIVTYDPSVHWNPQLYIENVFQEPKETIKYSQTKDINGGIIITEIRNVKGAFWERLELQNFPFDVQELSVTVASKLKRDEVRLVSDPYHKSKVSSSATKTFIDQQKWRLFKMVKMSQMASYDVEKENFLTRHKIGRNDHIIEIPDTPKISASCFCARRAGYYLFNAYFLIFLITGTAITIFSIDCKLNQNRIPACCTFLLTSVSFKWVINRYLPTISYLTSLDLYSITCILFVCVMCSWHAIVGANWSKTEAQDIDRWGLVGFSVSYLLINLSFVLWMIIVHSKVRQLTREEENFLNDSRKINNLAKVTPFEK